MPEKKAKRKKTKRVKKIIPFGAKVVDIVTGFTGYVKARYKHMNGCVRYEIQPPTKDNECGKLPDSQVLGEERLKILTVPEVVENGNYPENFKFGVKVKDRYSGFVGTVVLIIISKNKGLRYGVEPLVDKDGNMQELRAFDEEDLEQIDPLPKPSKSKEPKRTNGPLDSRVGLAR